ncbi:MAG: hemolysin family protein [Acidobacteriota bacterium]
MTGIAPDTLADLEIASICVLGLLYLLIGVFRSAAAELSPRAIGRILAARGLGSRDKESDRDMPSVMRMAFDVVHHLVLIASASVCFLVFQSSGISRPWLWGTLALGGSVIVVNVAARLLALSAPERAFGLTLIVVAVLYRGMRPLIVPIAWVVRRFHSIHRARRASRNGEEPAEDIEDFIDAGRQEGLLEPEESRLIRQVVEFHDSVVREVMTPRTEVVALPCEATVAEAKELFAKSRHSRIPVYRGQIDNVEGIITLKDLVAKWDELAEDSPVEKLMLPAYFVPETKQVSDLLKELQARRIQLSIVVDEYGGTAGVVSIEDILEELVGDIQEEHEQEEHPVVEESAGTYVAEGTASRDDLREALGVDVPGEGFETIAGLFYSVLGRIPVKGETIEVNGLRLEVMQADTRKIERVRITKLDSRPAG